MVENPRVFLHPKVDKRIGDFHIIFCDISEFPIHGQQNQNFPRIRKDAFVDQLHLYPSQSHHGLDWTTVVCWVGQAPFTPMVLVRHVAHSFALISHHCCSQCSLSQGPRSALHVTLHSLFSFCSTDFPSVASNTQKCKLHTCIPSTLQCAIAGFQ